MLCLEVQDHPEIHSLTLMPFTRGSHIDVACRSVCDRDQNGIKRSTFFLGADQGIKTNSQRLKSTDQCTFWHFLRYLAGMATFCPLNSRRIKRSRASERSDQAIKDDFYRSRFLIPVANASTGELYVTTPCFSCLVKRCYGINLKVHANWMPGTLYFGFCFLLLLSKKHRVNISF